MALLACALLAGCDPDPPRMGMPRAHGPLSLRVVHPVEGAAVEAEESTYLIGSVGHGAAVLWVNGRRVPVHRNGSFAAYLPLPVGAEPAYRLVVTLGKDTLRRILPVQLPSRRAALPLTGPLAIDTASLTPREQMRLRADEPVRVNVRAPANAEVWVAAADGVRHPLRANAPLPAAPGEARRGIPRRRDPERWTVNLSAARLARGAALVAARGADTVRLPLPPVEVTDPARPGWVVLGRTAGAGAEREIVGRPQPDGDYRWFFLPGTRVETTGARGEMVRVRLDSRQEAWVAREAAVPLEHAPAEGSRRTGTARLRPAADWVDLVIPLPAPPVHRVEQGEREVSLTLYGVELGAAAAAPVDGYVRGFAATRELRDRARYTLRLGAAPYGYRALWRDGTFILRLRRPPTVHGRTPLRGLTISVDAGHPPHGAVGPTGLRESDVTMQVAIRLRRLLEARGARVVMTRSGDAPVSLEERTARAVRADAHALVSIHADALDAGQDPSRVNGTATFFFHPQSAPLAAAVQRRMVQRMGRQDRGVRSGNLAVARVPWMPAVLCEGAMIIHPEEESALRTPRFQDAYARGIVNGLEDYFRALGEDP